MACEINASPSNGLVQSADGSGIIKLKSDGKTTNALAWVNFNGTGTVAIRSSYNVSSITDLGTGNYTVNFATALSDANYSTISSTSLFVDGTGWNTTVAAYPISTTQVSLKVAVASGATLNDAAWVSLAVFGN